MRRASRADENHSELTNALRGMGVSIVDLRLVGGGCPDLLCGIDGRTVLVELKRPPGPRGGLDDRTLSPRQLEWNASWRGEPAHIVRTVEEAVALVKAVRSFAETEQEA